MLSHICNFLLFKVCQSRVRSVGVVPFGDEHIALKGEEPKDNSLDEHRYYPANQSIVRVSLGIKVQSHRVTKHVLVFYSFRAAFLSYHFKI